MALYHVYSNAVPDGTATSVVRPSDWNSAHGQSVQLLGNTAGTSQVYGTDIQYRASGNLTIVGSQGTNNATVVISGGNGVGVGAAGNTVSNGNVVFSNSNGVSFGMAGSTVTASFGGGGGGGFTVYDGVGTSISSDIQFINSNGVSFGLNTVNRQMTASVEPPNYFSIADSVNTITDSVIFSNSPRVIFGLSNNVMTADIGVVVSAVGINGANSNIDKINFVNSNNIYWGADSTGNITAEFQGLNIVDNNLNITASLDLYLANSNNVSLGLSSNATSTYLYGSVNAINIADQNGSTINNGSVVFANSNGVSFGINGNTVTASAAGGGGGGATLSYFNNVPIINASTAQSILSTNLLIFPITVPANVSASYLRLPMSFGVLAGNSTIGFTSGSSTLSYGRTYNVLLYTAGTGTNNAVLQSYFSTNAYINESYVWSVSSNSAQTWSNYVTFPNTGGVGTLGLTSGNVSTAGGATIYLTTNNTVDASNLGGAKWFDVPFNTMLTPGVYWMAMNRSTNSGATGGANGFSTVVSRADSVYAVTQLSGGSFMPVGVVTNNASLSLWNKPTLGIGSATVSAQGATTATITFANISSIANHPVVPVQFIRQA